MMLHSRFTSLPIGLCLLAGFTLVVSQLGCYASNHYYRGLNYTIAKDYDSAIVEYSKAIELKPDYADAYLERGDAYRMKGNYDKAIADFNKAIELEPDYKPNYLNIYLLRSKAYFMKGNYDKAITDCNKAIELEPNRVATYRTLGLIYRTLSDNLIETGNYDNALENATIAIKQYNFAADAASRTSSMTDFITIIFSGQSLAYISRGEAYLKKDDNERAIANYTLAIEADPNDFAYMSRGNAYFKIGDYDNAIADFTRMINLKPTKSVGYTLRGTAYSLKGDKARAEADFLIAEQLKSVE